MQREKRPVTHSDVACVSVAMTDGPIIAPPPSEHRGIIRTVRELVLLWRCVLCFVLGVALILSAVWSSAVILSGARAFCILVVWLAIGAHLIVRALDTQQTEAIRRLLTAARD